MGFVDPLQYRVWSIVRILLHHLLGPTFVHMPLEMLVSLPGVGDVSQERLVERHLLRVATCYGNVLIVH